MAISQGEIAQRRQQIRNKILAVGKMQRVFQLLREEAENATELSTEEEMDMESASSDAGDHHRLGVGANALTVQGNHVRQNIRDFAAARRSDMVNERLPTFNPPVSPTAATFLPSPSMRRGSGDSENMEGLIKRTLENDDEFGVDGGMVDRLADRIARGRGPTGRPRALKRHETA